jgi:TolA-binding protein
MKSNKRYHFLVVTGWSLILLLASFQNARGTSNSALIISEPTNRESASAQQGQSRTEIERAAIQLYNEAVKKYQKKLYWKSAVDLIVILDFYSKFSRLDDVIYLLGNSLYEMGMYDGANRMYRYLLKAVPKTPHVANTILGLQKVLYQKKDYKNSLKFYKALETHYSNFDGINESRYYAGQAHFHLQNYTLVPQLLKHISSRSEFYPFGLYTSGLVQLKKKM